MAVHFQQLLRHLRRLGDRTASVDSDAVLLARFVKDRDEDAFAALVQRHGAMVQGVCRGILHDVHRAEDACQATWLVLARKAAGVRPGSRLATWLYGVARHVAWKVLRDEGRRSRRGIRQAASTATARDPLEELSGRELVLQVHEEVTRLPVAYRLPVLLCCLEGRSQEEAARQLGWTPGSVKGRLERGRARLQVRLLKRGLSFSAALAALQVPRSSSALTVSATAVARAALGFAAGKTAAASAGSQQAAALAEVVLHGITVTKIKISAFLILVLSLLAAGAGAMNYCTTPGQVDESAQSRSEPVPAKDPPVGKPAPPVVEPDVPAGATSIGTGQFRHTGWHSRVFFSGRSLLVIGEGVVVRWWDVETGKKLHEITLKGRYDNAAFAPEADLLAVVGTHWPDGENGKYEPVLWLIEAAARKLVRTVVLPARRGGNSQHVRISADGKRVFVEHEGDVQVIDGKTGDELIRHKGSINAGTLAASRDGKLVAFGRYDVFLWRWETGEEPKKFTSIGSFGTELMEFSPDGKVLYVIRGQVITTWDVASGRQTGSRPLRALMSNLTFSPDGRTLAITSHRSTFTPPEGGHAIDLIDAVTWKAVGRIPLGRAGVDHVSWSKDGSMLAGVSDYRAWAWDVKTGKVLSPARPGHQGLIAAMVFGPDGTLFTASDDHTIRSWDPVTGAAGLELVHDEWVRDVAVSADGSLVVGSSLRNDLRVWDAKTGKQRFKLLGNGMLGGKRRVRFTPDGKCLVAWGDDEFVRVWEVRNGKLLSEHSTRLPGIKSDPDDPFGDMLRFRSFDALDISLDPDQASREWVAAG